MICYDKRYLRTSRLNTIVEPHYGKDEEGNETILGYVYCDKSTFTDCILLQAKFDNNLTSMVAQIAPIEKHMPVINYFFEEAPKPLRRFLVLYQEAWSWRKTSKIWCHGFLF